MVTTNRVTWVSIPASACAVCTQCPRSARTWPMHTAFPRILLCLTCENYVLQVVASWRGMQMLRNTVFPSLFTVFHHFPPFSTIFHHFSPFYTVFHDPCSELVSAVAVSLQTCLQ